MLVRIKVAFILVATFFFSFVAATAITDSLARLAGFYDQGEADSACLESGDCE